MDVAFPYSPECSESGDPPGSLLQILAARVKERGLEIREHWRGGELTEIAVTNPQNAELVWAIMGCDGFFTWERHCKFASADDVRAMTQTISVILDENMRTHHIKIERELNA